MSVQWFTQARDWFDASISRLGLNTKPISDQQKLDTSGYTDISDAPHRHPGKGKDKRHPGDDADVQSSTEHIKEKPSTH